MDLLCIVIIFIVCVEQGDGHWDKKERENLRHDIARYRKIAEKLDRKIVDYFKEYPEENYSSNDDKISHQYTTHKLYGDINNVIHAKNKNASRNFFSRSKKLQNDGMSNEMFVSGETNNVNVKPTDTFEANVSWPTFEDILLDMGKKYDWKNDRWIKVKEKIKKSRHKDKINLKDDNNSVKFHEKHNFSYRMIKLEKGKNKRNIVVAVSAVR